MEEKPAKTQDTQDKLDIYQRMLDRNRANKQDHDTVPPEPKPAVDDLLKQEIHKQVEEEKREDKVDPKEPKPADDEKTPEENKDNVDNKEPQVLPEEMGVNISEEVVQPDQVVPKTIEEDKEQDDQEDEIF